MIYYKVVVTNRKTKEQLNGVLSPTGPDVKTPAELVKTVGVGTFIPGKIVTAKATLFALYNLESAANEADEDERQIHEQWMEGHGTKPGDAIGSAIDEQGNHFKFQSGQI